MIELAQHIEFLLLENDCVIIPDFGGFVAHYTSASYAKDDCLFLPPVRSIGFNPKLKVNDGVLVQSYMNRHATSFVDASRRVKKEVAELQNLLHEEGKVQLDNIGEIHCNIHGHYEFVSYDYKIATSSLYGLDSFEIKELAVMQEPSSLVKPVLEPKKKFEIHFNPAFLRHSVAVLAAIVLFFTFSTPLENTYIEKNNYAQLLPSDLLEQLENHSLAMNPVYANPLVQQSLADQAKKTKSTSLPKVKKQTWMQGEVQAASKIVTKETKVAPVQKEVVQSVKPAVLPSEVKSETLDMAKTPIVDVKKATAKGRFCLIVAGGIGRKDAEKIQADLQSKGFQGTSVVEKDGKIRVSIASFTRRAEANQALQEVRKMEGYQSAWLLVK